MQHLSIKEQDKNYETSSKLVTCHETSSIHIISTLKGLKSSWKPI